MAVIAASGLPCRPISVFIKASILKLAFYLPAFFFKTVRVLKKPPSPPAFCFIYLGWY